MGFSLTGAHVVFFIAAIIVSGAVSGIFIGITLNVSTSLTERGDRLQEQLDTEFAIINDPNNIPSEDSDYVFYFKNIGSRELATSNDTFQVFIDGDLVAYANYNFSNDTVQPSDYTKIYIAQIEIDAGDHTLRVVGPQAVEDEFTFEI